MHHSCVFGEKPAKGNRRFSGRYRYRGPPACFRPAGIVDGALLSFKRRSFRCQVRGHFLLFSRGDSWARTLAMFWSIVAVR